MAVTENQIDLMLDRIVVATDFTPESENALSYASAMAKRFASSLILVHVVDLSVATRSEDAVVGLPIYTMREEGQLNIEKAVKSLTDQGLRVQGQTLESYSPSETIVGLAEEVGADLLVIGTRSKSGLSRLILGSFAEGAIHHAKCPVLTVGPHTKKVTSEGFSFRTIVFATDLRHHTAEKAAIALAFAQDSIAKIYLCHVLDSPDKKHSDTIELQSKTEEALRQLIPDSSYDWCNADLVVEYGDIGEHLLKVAQDVGADLIVLGARRHETWWLPLNKGIVGRVLAEATCPVLSICTN